MIPFMCTCAPRSRNTVRNTLPLVLPVRLYRYPNSLNSPDLPLALAAARGAAAPRAAMSRSASCPLVPGFHGAHTFFFCRFAGRSSAASAAPLASPPGCPAASAPCATPTKASELAAPGRWASPCCIVKKGVGSFSRMSSVT